MDERRRCHGRRCGARVSRRCGAQLTATCTPAPPCRRIARGSAKSRKMPASRATVLLSIRSPMCQIRAPSAAIDRSISAPSIITSRPVKHLIESDPIRLEQIGWVAALPCAGEPHARIDGGRTKPAAAGKPVPTSASRLPDQPSPDRGVVVTPALAGIDEGSKRPRLVEQ